MESTKLKEGLKWRLELFDRVVRSKGFLHYFISGYAGILTDNNVAGHFHDRLVEQIDELCWSCNLKPTQLLIDHPVLLKVRELALQPEVHSRYQLGDSSVFLELSVLTKQYRSIIDRTKFNNLIRSI